MDHAGGQVTPTTCATQGLAYHLKLSCLCAQNNQMLWEPDSYATWIPIWWEDHNPIKIPAEGLQRPTVIHHHLK